MNHDDAALTLRKLVMFHGDEETYDALNHLLDEVKLANGDFLTRCPKCSLLFAARKHEATVSVVKAPVGGGGT